MYRGRTRDISARARISRGSLRGIACQQNVAFFEGVTAVLIDVREEDADVVIERDGMWTSSRNALSDFAVVRIGSFGTDIVYPGKLTAGSQGEEKKRLFTERHLLPRERAIDRPRVTLQLFAIGVIYRQKRPRVRTCN